MRFNLSSRLLLYELLPLISIFFFSFAELFSGQIYIILSLFCILPFLFTYLRKNNRASEINTFLIFVIIGSILNLFVTSNGIGGTLLFITAFSITLYCLLHLSFARVLSFFVLIYNILYISKAIFVDFISPEFIYENLGLSRNYPGYLLVVWTCFHSFTKYVTLRQVSVILPIVSFIVSFFLEGRASMATLLFVCLLSFYLRNKKTVYIFPIIAIVVLNIFWNDIVGFFELTRFATESMDSSRTEIWKAYIESLDFISFFLGLDTLSVPLIASYGGNPHNAFFNYHLRMGLLGLLPLLYYIYFSAKRYIRGGNFFLFTLLLSLIIRFSFDANLNTRYDFIFYSLIFYPIIYKRGYPVAHKSKKKCFMFFFQKISSLI